MVPDAVLYVGLLAAIVVTVYGIRGFFSENTYCNIRDLKVIQAKGTIDWQGLYSMTMMVSSPYFPEMGTTKFTGLWAVDNDTVTRAAAYYGDENREYECTVVKAFNAIEKVKGLDPDVNDIFGWALMLVLVGPTAMCFLVLWLWANHRKRMPLTAPKRYADPIVGDETTDQ